VKRFFSLLLFGLLFVGILAGGCSQAREETFTNSIGMEFVLIPAGKFKTPWHKNDFGEIVYREVTISKPFYLGKYEVTQEQWVAVMGDNPSVFKGRTNPVDYVSWEDASAFIQKLNKKEGVKKYRLPTDAEWEHAARAGTDTEWFFGKDPADLGKYAWFSENCQGTTHPVGKKNPNPWGLYDIYGNVCEWVQDWYEREWEWVQMWDWYEEDEKEGWAAVTDPTGPASGSDRVSRGGSWVSTVEGCLADLRDEHTPDFRDYTLGFRLAFSPSE